MMDLYQWAESALPNARIVYASPQIGRDETGQIVPVPRAIYPGAKKDARELFDAGKVMLFQRRVPLLDGDVTGFEMIAVRVTEKAVRKIEDATLRMGR